MSINRELKIVKIPSNKSWKALEEYLHNLAVYPVCNVQCTLNQKLID